MGSELSIFQHQKIVIPETSVVVPSGGCALLEIFSTVSSGIVHCYDFEEASGNRIDHVGSSHFSPVNSPTSAPVSTGDGVVFDGTNYLEVTASSNMLFNVAGSLSFKFIIDAIPPSAASILAHGGSSSAGNYDWLIFIMSTGKLLVSFGGGFGGVITSTETFTTGTLNSLVITRSSTELKLKTNSTAIQTSVAGFGTIGTTAKVTVGCIGTGNHKAICKVDTLVFWNRVLNSTEIDQVINEVE